MSLRQTQTFQEFNLGILYFWLGILSCAVGAGIVVWTIKYVVACLRIRVTWNLGHVDYFFVRSNVQTGTSMNCGPPPTPSRRGIIFGKPMEAMNREALPSQILICSRNKKRCQVVIDHLQCTSFVLTARPLLMYLGPKCSS